MSARRLALLFILGACAAVTAGCATGRRSNLNLEVRLAQAERAPGLLRMDDPNENWPIYVMPEAVLRADDVSKAGLVKIKAPLGSESREPLPGVLIQFSWFANRRLKSAVAEHTTVLRDRNGRTFKKAPRLAILLDGKVIAVIPVKGEVRSDTILMVLPTMEMARRVVAGLNGELPPDEATTLVR